MQNAQDVTARLGGRWYGRFGKASCPICQAGDPSNPALNILTSGTGNSELDKFTLNESVVFKCHKCQSKSWEIKQRLFGRTTDVAVPALVASHSKQQHDRQSNANHAAIIWRDSQPIEGTPAETYLRRRGITGPLPPSLRFHPNLWHADTKQFAFALVATIRRTLAVHRIFLKPDGTKLTDAYPVKLTLGSLKGGCVDLASSADGLVVAEGIETALSVPLLYPQLASFAVHATLGTAGMASYRLASSPKRLVIAADGGSAGRKAAQKLADRAVPLGWNCQIVQAPDNKDFNDLLMERMHGE